MGVTLFLDGLKREQERTVSKSIGSADADENIWTKE
jgi:hypothetical protein